MFSLPFKKNKDIDAVYEEKRFLVGDEEVFFGRLRRALPHCYIFPKIDLASLLEPGNPDSRIRQAELAQLDGKKVDYGVFDASLALLCVIELCAKDAGGCYVSNKKLFETAGIKTIRWDKEALPTLEQILRTLAPFSTIDSPKPDVAASTIVRTQFEENKNADTVQAIYKSHPTPSNIEALSIIAIEKLTPDQHIKRDFPHVWERICLFCNEPQHLKRYLASLSLQDRGVERVGFPREVLREIAVIQAENERYIQRAVPRTTWHNSFINR
ncbi:DUF2726 domain-containing protein [Undibacterium sp.]|jgi:hypothetical protein|uniref:DUF2726 domain-containing protein n=1 Tax=Undibacterium sp. TaxID=1914977 RepID=UPI002D0A6DDC|nr:DUF2726 domain-containing protein [Undibacterium sp.]HTD03037.1 DUF2726 domain-containing protein [Undibacterium sp.]